MEGMVEQEENVVWEEEENNLSEDEDGNGELVTVRS